LDSGCPRQDVAASLRECYAEGSTISAPEIDQFVEQLLDESLLVPGVGSSALDAQHFVAKLYEPPKLHKYDDLQELLFLDPVRGVPAIEG
jgi:hypothetical protein